MGSAVTPDESRPLALYITRRAEQTQREVEPFAWLAAGVVVVFAVLLVAHLVARFA